LGSLATIGSGGPLGICAGKPLLALTAHVGKQAWGVLAIEVDVAEHCGCTVAAVVIDVIKEWAREFLEGTTALVGRKFWPFALACDDCVVLELKVHGAI
jgi:hypothetical protein